MARVFAPQRMGMMLLLGIGGLAFVGVPMNALFLQDGRHPAPLFSAHTLAPQKAEVAEETAAAPAAQPETSRAEAPAAKPDALKAEIAPPVAKPGKSDAAALKALLTKSEAAPAPKAEKKREVVSRDPIATMIGGGDSAAKPKAATQTHAQTKAAAPKSVSQTPKAQPQAQAQQPQAQAPTESVVSAQRALQRLGYVVKPDGVVSAGTKQAIEKFERDNGLPAKGELTSKISKLLATRAAPPHQ